MAQRVERSLSKVVEMSAREKILASIRSHLAESLSHEIGQDSVDHGAEIPSSTESPPMNGLSLAELFKQNLEAVDGHCVIVDGESEVVEAMTKIVAGLQQTRLKAKSLALSDNLMVERLVKQMPLDVDELQIAPSSSEVFHFDVGITSAQAAIAETGTLVLDGERERHRVVSLVPPVHIAILEAKNIFSTLGQTLADIQARGSKVSRLVTFVTGPSRTADIELTLAIGVHGPQELYVIINQGMPLEA